MNSDVTQAGGHSEAVSDRSGATRRASYPGELTETFAELSIESMLRLVPEGETRLFERLCKDNGEERFFSVHQNFNYPYRTQWHNMLSFGNNPSFKLRWVPRISVFSLPEPDVTFKGPAETLIDFYSTGNHAFFLSERLVALFDRLDPGSLERRPVIIRGREGKQFPFFMAMPSRSLSVIDPRRTDVLIQDKDYGGQWIRSVKFPNGVSFSNEDLEGVYSFTDLDLSRWFWSRELIDTARSEGIKGVEFMSARTITNLPVDLL